MSQKQEKIADRFRLLEKLGQGGMGEVYKAEDELLKKTVAIKLLVGNASDDMKIRFQKEAKAIANLSHPGIVSAFDFGITKEGAPYLVIDYLDGESLNKIIQSEGNIAIGEAVDLTLQLCSALSFAHNSGILHRDIKPSNVILIQKDGDRRATRILDFGLVKFGEEEQKQTNTGVAIGSPTYMSPEQARGEEADVRSDIYSLGCLLFEMITGSPPIKGDSPLDTINLKLSEPAPALFSIIESDHTFDNLNNILARCLAIKKTDRYSSVEELAAELEAIDDAHDADNQGNQETGEIKDSKEVVLSRKLILAALLVVGFLALLTMGVFDQQNKPAVAPAVDTSSKARWTVPQVEWKNGSIKVGNNFVQSRCDERFMRQLGNQLRASGKTELEIKFLSTNLKGAGLGFLAPAQLRILKINNSIFDQQSIECLGKLQSLRGLNVQDPVLEKAEFTGEFIGKLDELEELCIVGSRVSGALIESLRSLKSLRVLDLHRSEILEPESLKLLNAYPSLIRLSLGGKVDGSDLVRLKGCRQLEVLTITDVQAVTAELLSAVYLLPLLNDLFLERTEILPGALAKLSRSPTLNHLRLSEVRARGTSLFQEIDSIGQLRSLSITSGSHIPEPVWLRISELSRVTSIKLKEIEIPDKAWHQLGKLKRLRQLSLINVATNDETWSSIKRMQRLRDLNLSRDIEIPTLVNAVLKRQNVRVNRVSE